MQTSEQVNEIFTAMAKAQASIKNAVKDSTNPHFRSSYADLASIWDSCKDALTGNGITVIQAPEAGDDGSVVIHTMLGHTSGQWIRSSLPIRPAKNDAQGVGSAITYGRRYSLAAMAGVAPDDDDGEAAVGRPQQQTRSAAKPRQAQQAQPNEDQAALKLEANIKRGEDHIKGQANMEQLDMVSKKWEDWAKDKGDSAVKRIKTATEKRKRELEKEGEVA